MKKMKVHFSSVVFMLLAVSFVMFSGIAKANDVPTVDGFIGVPWGADRLQVAAVMKEKDFTLSMSHFFKFNLVNSEIDTRDLADVYQGIFAGYPAELYFDYRTDVFYEGEVFLLSFQGDSLDVARSGYNDIVSLLKAKYGAPDYDAGSQENWNLCRWDNIQTKVGAPARVVISVQGGRIPDYHRKNLHLYGVWLKYEYQQMRDI